MTVLFIDGHRFFVFCNIGTYTYFNVNWVR